ncbi:MAG: DUF3622 domain-containing protein [Opitutaceae bacterium]|nr:DUF3622 domain-containing protein [Opitutaceae bacterium]
MSRSKKISCCVIKSAGGYTAQVLRRGTARGTTVEREQTGFTERASAEQWAAQALAGFLAVREAHKLAKRKSRRRAGERCKARAEWLALQTLQSLAAHCEANGEYREVALDEIKSKAETLWQEIVFRAIKQGEGEKRAFAWANESVGRNWTERWGKALSGDLDRLTGFTRDLAIANAKRTLAIGNLFVEVSRARQ